MRYYIQIKKKKSTSKFFGEKNFEKKIRSQYHNASEISSVTYKHTYIHAYVHTYTHFSVDFEGYFDIIYKKLFNLSSNAIYRPVFLFITQDIYLFLIKNNWITVFGVTNSKFLGPSHEKLSLIPKNSIFWSILKVILTYFIRNILNDV